MVRSMMLSRLSLRSSLLAILFVGFLAALPLRGFAATNAAQCTCFCGTSQTGAVDLSTYPDAASCANDCAETGSVFVGCYTDSAQFPDQNRNCWTKEECSSYLSANGKSSLNAWGGLNPYCPVLLSGTETGYCYSPGNTNVKLNVPILGQTSVRSFPEYLSLAYKFLIPAASMIAVIMVMVGGVQYATSRGNAKAVDQAKERISNAIIGLVLLMSAYVIANLLDPRLVMFDRLRVPLVKQVILLDPNSTCETLVDVGYSVKATEGKSLCGYSGEITSVDGVKDVVLGSKEITVGDSCKYSTCLESNSACQADGTCIKCYQIPDPSIEACSRAEQLDNNPKTEDRRTQYYCRYDSKLQSCVTVGRDQEEGGMLLSDVRVQGFSCSALRSDALESRAGCLEYSKNLQMISSSEIRGFATSPAGAGILSDVCNEDPCGLAEIVGASSCAYDGSTADENAGNCTNVGLPSNASSLDASSTM